MLIQPTAATIQRGIFGCYGDALKYYAYTSSYNGTIFQVGMGDWAQTDVLVDTSKKFNIEFDAGKVLFDGVQKASFLANQGTTPHPLTMFALRRNNGTLYTSLLMRGYFLKMWRESSPIRDLTPVRVGTDATSWEGAMMDVLTRRIYRNAGTGAFTYGNDQPLETLAT